MRAEAEAFFMPVVIAELEEAGLDVAAALVLPLVAAVLEEAGLATAVPKASASVNPFVPRRTWM